MFEAYVEQLIKEKYLKINNSDQWTISYPGRLKVIDCHIHLSNILPGKQKDPMAVGKNHRYPILPPPEAFDLSVPYWTKMSHLNRKFVGMGAVLRFSIDGIKIFNDMVDSGTYDNCFITQENNGIVKSVMLPISTAKSDQSLPALEAADKYPERLIAFCSVHPNDPKMQEKIVRYSELGAKGLKLKITEMELDKYFHETVQLLQLCHNNKMPVLFHTGTTVEVKGVKLLRLMKKLLVSTRVELFGKLLEKAPKDIVFIFAHSGVQEYKLVAKYMELYQNTYAELSSQSEDSMRYLIEKVGSERLLFGSDWPALPSAITLSRVLLATEGDVGARDNILYKNAEKLFKL